jgi:hypothetical protein
MNLFYKIHLQAFNVIYIVLYHSGPTFGQVLYSCLDAFVVDASDYWGHLTRHLLNASEAFPTEWFLQFWDQSKSGGLSPPLFDLFPKSNQKVAGSIPDGVIEIFHWHNSFQSHYGSGLESASNRNEYNENFWGVNAAGA